MSARKMAVQESIFLSTGGAPAEGQAVRRFRALAGGRHGRAGPRAAEKWWSMIRACATAAVVFLSPPEIFRRIAPGRPNQERHHWENRHWNQFPGPF